MGLSVSSPRFQGKPLVWFCWTGQRQRNSVIPFLKAFPWLPSVALKMVAFGDVFLVLDSTPGGSPWGAMDVIVNAFSSTTPKFDQTLPFPRRSSRRMSCGALVRTTLELVVLWWCLPLVVTRSDAQCPTSLPFLAGGLARLACGHCGRSVL
jgi:hypothetical protein